MLLSNKCLQNLSSYHKEILLIEFKNKVEEFHHPCSYKEHHELSIISTSEKEILSVSKFTASGLS